MKQKWDRAGGGIRFPPVRPSQNTLKGKTLFENYHDGEDPKAVANLLEGRRIVSVNENTETLTLDNGQVLEVHPNGGCGGCPSGYFWLNDLAEFDNIITRAEVRSGEAEPDEYGDADEILSIYVYAEGIAPKRVIEVQGNVGNGYYGRGFEIEVRNPKSGE